jgi:hypothetical protein
MTDSNSFFSESKKEIESYLENRALLIKMQAISTSSRLIAKLVVGMVLGLLGFCLVFFLSIMAGYFFADLTGSLYIGYGIVVFVYLLFFLLVYWNCKKIGSAISDSIIQILFNKDE